VAFVPLWFALKGQSPCDASALGGIAGATMVFGGFLWLPNTIHRFLGYPIAVCGALFLVFCVYHGGKTAMMSWLFARAAQRAAPLRVAFVLAFVASELAFPSAFPWYFGATVHDVPVFAQIAELGGPIAIGVVLLAANIGLAELLQAAVERRPFSWRVIAATGAVVAVAVAFGAARIAATDAAVAGARSVAVGVVQGNLDIARTPPVEALARLRRMTIEAREAGAEVIFWSETSLPFEVSERTAAHVMRNVVARDLDVPLVLGASVSREGGDLFNAALTVSAGGALTGRYDKRKLFPIGEFIPWSRAIPALAALSPKRQFHAGEGSPHVAVEVGGVSRAISVLLCYEDVFPAFANTSITSTRPELLVTLADDSWFGSATEMSQHLALAQLRAIEHRRYLVRGTNTGISALVDPVGRVLARSTPFREQRVHGIARWMNGGTVYETLGDAPWLVASLGAFAFALVCPKGVGASARRWRRARRTRQVEQPT
jgi:apolipoprotein N-acyltransferase